MNEREWVTMLPHVTTDFLKGHDHDAPPSCHYFDISNYQFNYLMKWLNHLSITKLPGCQFLQLLILYYDVMFILLLFCCYINTLPTHPAGYLVIVITCLTLARTAHLQLDACWRLHRLHSPQNKEWCWPGFVVEVSQMQKVLAQPIIQAHNNATIFQSLSCRRLLLLFLVFVAHSHSFWPKPQIAVVRCSV